MSEYEDQENVALEQEEHPPFMHLVRADRVPFRDLRLVEYADNGHNMSVEQQINLMLRLINEEDRQLNANNHVIEELERMVLELQNQENEELRIIEEYLSNQVWGDNLDVVIDGFAGFQINENNINTQEEQAESDKENDDEKTANCVDKTSSAEGPSTSSSNQPNLDDDVEDLVFRQEEKLQEDDKV